MDIHKIGVITSGGDCGGLNAVILGAARMAAARGLEAVAIPNGYAGLYNLVEMDSLVSLSGHRLDPISIGLAGSECGHSRVKIAKIEDADKYERIKAGLRKHGIDALVISGGDDTGTVMVDLARQGVRCVHAPKTMDLDLMTYSVGGDSTINRIREFIRDMATTGRTHNRIIIVQVFGRYAGHTAFRGGVAAQADAILIPEVPVDFAVLYAHMKERYFDRIRFSDINAGTYMIVVAEGLKDASGRELIDESVPPDPMGHRKLAGAGKYVQQELEKLLKQDPEVVAFMKEQGMYVPGVYERPEVRVVVPEHLVRCGFTSSYDANFGMEAGAAAVLLLLKGFSGVTVAGQRNGRITYMKTRAAIKQRHVSPQQIAFYERLGFCFGRKPRKPRVTVEEVRGAVPRMYD